MQTRMYSNPLRLFLLFFLMVASIGAMNEASAADGRYDKIKIKSSVQCGQCSARIHAALDDQEGIRKVDVDLEDQIIKVKYNPDEISAGNIRRLVTEAGYAADDLPADMDAFADLPNCCKPGKKGSCQGKK